MSDKNRAYAYGFAYAAANHAVKDNPLPRRPRTRWDGQNQWDKDNMVTESTQFTKAMDAELRRCCAAAGVNRSQLIHYLLTQWIGAWNSWEKERENDGS